MKTAMLSLLAAVLLLTWGCSEEDGGSTTDVFPLDRSDADAERLQADTADATSVDLASVATDAAELVSAPLAFGTLADWEQFGASHALLCTNTVGHGMTLEEVGWLHAANLSAEVTMTLADGSETPLFSFHLADMDNAGEIIYDQPCVLLTAQKQEDVTVTFTVFAEDGSVAASVSESFSFLPARAGSLLWRVGLGRVAEQATCPAPVEQELNLPEAASGQAYATILVGVAHEQFYPHLMDVVGTVFDASVQCLDLQPLLAGIAAAGPDIALTDSTEGGCYSDQYGTFAPVYMPTVASAVGLAARLLAPDSRPEGLVAVHPVGIVPDAPTCASTW